jgi:threonine dehydrogenase-like Zn-dependent dehydrogenase
MQSLMPEGADLVYELSGAPEALNTAIKMTGFAGRIVVGSWYGQKQAGLDLGGRFHRSRIQIKSSQVSTLAPELTGRWTKQRRFDLAWDMIRRLEPQRFITHRFPLRQAGEAYNLLVQHPEKALQILFQYEELPVDER